MLDDNMYLKNKSVWAHYFNKPTTNNFLQEKVDRYKYTTELCDYAQVCCAVPNIKLYTEYGVIKLE